MKASPSIRVAHIELKTSPDFQKSAAIFYFAVYTTYSLQSGKDWQGEGGDLDSASNQIRYDEHEHSDL